MGRHKVRLKHVKNCERRGLKGPVGRPHKRTTTELHSTSPSSAETTSEVSLSFNSSSPESVSYDTSSTSTDTGTPVPSDTLSHQSLVASVKLPNSKWVVQDPVLESVAICKLSEGLSTASQSLLVTHCIVIKDDLSWSVSVHGAQVDASNCGLLSKRPPKMHMQYLQSLVSLLDTCATCPGHPDSQFVDMVEAKKGQLMSKDSKCVSKLDDFAPVTCDGEQYAITVRVSTCEIIVSAGKCKSCVAYRNSLRKIHHCWSKQRSCSPSDTYRSSPRSKTNVRWLNTPEKVSRYTKLRKRLCASSRVVKRLQEKIARITENNHLNLDSTTRQDLNEIMSEMTEKVHSDCPEGSFRSFFGIHRYKPVM